MNKKHWSERRGTEKSEGERESNATLTVAERRIRLTCFGSMIMTSSHTTPRSASLM